MPLATETRSLRLRVRPQGRLADEHFEMKRIPIPQVAEGQVRIRIIYLSVDPTNRIWASDRAQYMPPVELGQPMRSGGIGVIEESRNSGFKAGDLVGGIMGWQEHVVCEPQSSFVSKLPDLPVPLPAFLGVLGVAGGITSYFGMLDIGKPKAKETVVVTGAAGTVGSIAGQLAKIQGARVIGVAGGPEKCKYVVNELGFDACIDYKKEDIGAALDRHCPNGIDVNYENVGGPAFEEILKRLNFQARVALCGLISSYNEAWDIPGPKNFAMILMRSVRLTGFIVTDYAQRFGEAYGALIPWVLEGRIKYRQHIIEGGLEVAPRTVNMLFDGANHGKLLIKLSDEPRKG
jgi:NADPH-dependent curcumin reductase CurA